LAAHEQQIATLLDDAHDHVANISQGNRELGRAKQYGAAARLWVLFVVLAISGGLLFLDWFAW